jgi:DNA modification methylase
MELEPTEIKGDLEIKKIKQSHFSDITPTSKMFMRNVGLPSDYHCTCNYCTKNYLGELFHTPTNQFYSGVGRKKYYHPDKHKHIAEGQYQGYRYAVQEWSSPGDWVFDPTVGTGTAIVESINNGRNGIGIELEFPEIARKNIDFQSMGKVIKPTGKHIFVHGDARNTKKILEENGFGEESIQLVLNGTPYPKLSSISSDSPQRNLMYDKDGKLTRESAEERNYKVKENFGLYKGNAFSDLISGMYLDCIPFMKKGAKMVILIKDMSQNKKSYLLHKYVVDDLLSKTDKLKYFGCYIHRHLPYTLHMNTYNSIHPDAEQVPMYQTGIVLEKI